MLVFEGKIMSTSYAATIRTGVYGVALHHEKILLIVQEEGPYKDKFDLPGGGIEWGETIEEALRREFAEEVNRGFKSMEFLVNMTSTVLNLPKKLHRIGLIYVVNHLHDLETISQEPLSHDWIDPS